MARIRCDLLRIVLLIVGTGFSVETLCTLRNGRHRTKLQMEAHPINEGGAGWGQQHPVGECVCVYTGPAKRYHIFQ